MNAAKGAGYASVIGKGALQGGILGAGGAENYTDIPAEVARGAITGGVTGGVLKGAGDLAGYVKREAGPVLARVVGGVEPKNYNAYLANPERINAIGALGDSAVKDSIDSGVGQVQAYKGALTDRVGQIEDTLNRSYDLKRMELAGTVTPLDKAKEMAASLGAQKTYLHSLSEQADDALSRSGVSFKKKDLLRAIDKIGKKEGVAIGDEAHSALSKLQTTRDRIAEQLPDEIPATQIRDVLQQLRKDVSYDMGAGEFNDTLNGMRKDFSKNISNALKKQVPDYAKYMKRMSDLAENLGTMNRYFGDESKALGSLEVLRKGGAKSQIIEDALKNHATVNADQTLLQHLDDVRSNHALLGRMKAGEDLRPSLFPKEWNALQEAQANLDMTNHVYDGSQINVHPLNSNQISSTSLSTTVNPSSVLSNSANPVEREVPAMGGISRLSPERTQAIIKNMGGTNANIMDQRELENLSNITGKNYLQDIADKNVFDSFKKSDTNGARKSVLGAAIGGGIGGAIAGTPGAYIGSSLGAAAGGVLDKYGPAIVKGTIDSTIGLKKLAESSGGWKAFGPYATQLAEAASKGNAQLAITNQMLLKTDPLYRSIFKTDKHQQGDAKREAIARRAQGGI